MKRKGLAALTWIGCLAFGLSSWAQRSSNWRAFRLADGLPESACAAVALAPQGKVLVRHLNQPILTELDGYGVSTIPAPDKGAARIYQSPGGQLWTVFPGGLREARDGAWVSHSVPEIAAHFHAAEVSNIQAVPLFPVRQGLVLFLLPDRLTQFSSEQDGVAKTEVLRQAADMGLGQFTGMVVAADGSIWLSGTRGVAKGPNPRSIRPDSEWQIHLAPAELNLSDFRQPNADGAGALTMAAEIGTDGRQAAVVFDGQNWKVRPATREKLIQAWRGPEDTIWAITRDNLLQWPGDESEAVENDEISARQYYDVAVELSGAFWLATSEGLFRFAPLPWRIPAPLKKFRSLVPCLAADREGRLWLIAGNGLHRLERDRLQTFPFPAASARNLMLATGLFLTGNGNVVLESNGELFAFQPDKGFLNLNSAGKWDGQVRVLGTLADGRLCVQRFSRETTEGSSQPIIETCDGSRLELFAEGLPEPSVGTHLTALFAAQNGDLWLSGEKGTAWFHEKKWRVFTSIDGSTPDGAISFLELPDGKTWCATSDKIWEFDGRNWMALRRGFDRISSMVRARDGSVWVASNSGLHRYSQGDWIEHGVEEGLASASVRALCEDQSGKLWAGTTHGLDWYSPEADPDPPRTTIEPISEEEKNLPEGQGLSIAFSGQDKWKYTHRIRLLYSYRIDQKEWSPFSEENRVLFSELPAGKHYFQVRAIDRNCNVDLKPPQFEFNVVLPWYREKRLVLISGAGLAVAFFFAALAFNRHRRLLRGYAEIEKKIRQRTQELEMANRELVHSQKMNALGTLAAGIAHDFNNILSIIKGSAQIIEENLADDQKVQTRVDRIKTVVEQGSGIVKAMLGFTRETDQPSGLCDLNAAVEDTLKLLGDRFMREVQVTFEPADSLAQAPCSKDFVQQILLNFIFNAADSMTRRKQITIATTQSETLPKGMVLMPVQSPGYACISVQDSGCGIPAENLPRIFEPFFTTKALSTRRGTGLGLSMVYELAKKMDAGLAVETVVDQGSKFTLILPVRDKVQSSAKPAEARESDIATVRS